MAVPWPYGTSAQRRSATLGSLIPVLSGTYRHPAGVGEVTHLHHCHTSVRVVIPVWYHSRMAFTLRTDAELEQALDALAEGEGLSRQEVIRRAVLDRYERAGHARRVADATERTIDEWGDVLDRLGSV